MLCFSELNKFNQMFRSGSFLSETFDFFWSNPEVGSYANYHPERLNATTGHFNFYNLTIRDSNKI